MRVQEIVGMLFARMQRVEVLSSVKLPLRSSRYIYYMHGTVHAKMSFRIYL